MFAAPFAPLNQFAPGLPPAPRMPTFTPPVEVTRPAETQATTAVGQDARVNRAAGTILNFVHNQLKVDAEAGRSSEQLQSRFDAGAEGFLKGFNEALEELDARGLLSPELEAELGATRDKVLQGLRDMAQEFGLNTDALPAEEAPAPVEPPVTQPPSAMSGVVFGRNSFSFSLTTQEGDKVTISSVSRFGQAASVSDQGFGFYQQQSQRFSFNVEGDLNENEMAALNDLLGQVNDLSEMFYSGDLEGAFDAALALDFDANEIAGYALDLRQTMVTKVRTVYGQPAAETSPVRQQMQPFAQLADQIEQALEKAKEFLQPLALLGDLMEQTAPGIDHEGRAGKHKLFSDVGQAMAQKLLNG
ncbi:DUF5610 domain-containing protein [Simiduia agarivorans]|uniref:DUF5610 domain-containing protein n=1 Tax=Simiduia agarivorans (strain DSM 21679 / JCM 13881 / BCRC 17597 / SA1) TaxID=1117647 RepID=K4KEH1_SIMAS|nr:DUF5610 domain-containing protein [Simiduia agarivorans]AFU97449.1 hypothetical protein M5M_01090 [Simiduia agarivorans SA1 = DSM 21679]